MADKLLRTLILASEKASRIARLCRENKELFSLLIQEKGKKHNEIDFKTFADVFIQQIVTKEVRMEFGDLADRVEGEENNQFTNPLGETVSVEIGADAKDTTDMLSKILDGNETAAKVLAGAAHDTTSLDLEAIVTSDVLKEISASDLDLDKVGMWVDPIDCTSQYVKGIEDATPNPRGIYEAGLQCVLVLIGVYSIETGEPVMGVLNEPFCTCAEKTGRKRWKSRCVWGFSYNGVNRNNLLNNTKILPNNSHSSKRLVVLSLHDPKAMAAIKTLSSTVDTCLSRGAGYKILTVVDQLSHLFAYTSSGSYKWDTCGPHAILNSLGGGMAKLDDAIQVYGDEPSSDKLRDLLKKCQVKYTAPDETLPKWKSNCGGLLVYNGTEESWDVACKILKAFSDVQA